MKNTLEEKIGLLEQIEDYDCQLMKKLYAIKKQEEKQKLEKKKWETLRLIKNRLDLPDNKTILLFTGQEEKIKTRKNVISFSKYGSKTKMILQDKINSIPEGEIGIALEIKEIDFESFYETKMRRKRNAILNQLENTSLEEIKKNPKKTVKQIIHAKVPPLQEVSEKLKLEEVVYCIQEILEQKKVEVSFFYLIGLDNVQLVDKQVFICNELENIAKVLQKPNQKEKYAFIYQTVCTQLDTIFTQNQYCDFRENRCISQRHRLRDYPVNHKNGCCFMAISPCKQMDKMHQCTANCLPCKLFTCHFLTKRGITYSAYEIPLLKCFFSKKQRMILVNCFYTSQDKLIKELLKEAEKQKIQG